MLSKAEKSRTLSHIYTPYSELKAEIKRRSEDSELQARIKEFFGDHFLEYMGDVPKAVLSRSIATPNTELRYFLDLTKSINIEPLVLEYMDMFVARNTNKYHLCKLHFKKGNNQNGCLMFETECIVNFNHYEGKMFNNIKTIWGEDLKDFHHELLFSSIPNFNENVKDFTKWFNETKNLEGNYYVYFLSLFIGQGILFDNFLIDDKEESDFLEKRFFPSFYKVQEIFGIKPLIYPLLPFEREVAPQWLFYSDNLHQIVQRKMLRMKKVA